MFRRFFRVEISVKDFFLLMLDKIFVLILSAIIGFAAFFGYAKITEVPSYTCTITMIVNTAPNQSISTGTIAASQDLVKAYIAIMKDLSFVEKISNAMPESSSLTVDDIRRSMSMQAVDESQILAVDVTTDSARDSYIIAKKIEEIAPKTLRKYFDDTGSIVVLRDAKMPKEPNPSSTNVKGVLGALIGFAVAVSVILLIAKLDRRVKSEEDIAFMTKYPLIGTIGSVK